ncbi:HIT domain-containing protein [Methylocapsa sp. S129]|uniref:HIT domain-containing protein n=1 Tax=Methylocapsa sp. S129 TaxID=1641869 RepID=UPI001FF02C1A|nr:HIT family protein [Methylocapsa sp. S129]
MSFALDTRLAADTIEIGDLALSRLLLMNDARYLWLVLVPRQENLCELVDLDARDRAILMEEITAASKALIGLPGVDKINVGALGNIVRQLHIHVVARRLGDAAWPGPVWGAGAPLRYGASRARKIVQGIKGQLIRGAAS